jgi:hypothetical protein
MLSVAYTTSENGNILPVPLDAKRPFQDWDVDISKVPASCGKLGALSAASNDLDVRDARWHREILRPARVINDLWFGRRSGPTLLGKTPLPAWPPQPASMAMVRPTPKALRPKGKSIILAPFGANVRQRPF